MSGIQGRLKATRRSDPTTKTRTRKKMPISEERYAKLKKEREEHFADKTKIKRILSLMAHKGIITKLIALMDGCTHSLEALPSQRGA